MTTEPVRFPADDVEIGGEIVAPAGTARGSLVLIPDVHGVSDLYRRLAGRFAERGYRTLVLDLYTRQGKPTLPDPAAVARWIDALDDRRVLGDVSAAANWLRASQPGRVAVTGFCVGGQYAFLSACNLPDLAACVAFYGMLRGTKASHKPETPLEAAPRLACPYLGIFGAEDALIPSTDVEELRGILTRHGKEFAIEIFPGAGHAFLNDTRPDAHRPAAAERAFELAVEFLNRHVH